MTRIELVQDLILRSVSAATLSIFAYRVWEIESYAPSMILSTLLVSELLIVVLVLFSKTTSTRSFSMPAMISTAAGTFYFLFIQLDNGRQLVPIWFSEAVMMAGLVLQISAKLYLGRNFGLLPAVRGIVTGGPYKIVRHPIYLGYLITHAGFLLNVFSFQNVLILTLLYIFQAIRLVYEEKALQSSPEYRSYAERVTKRVIPYVI